MDKLKTCLDALRVLARQSHDPNAQLLAERRINEYLQREIDDLRTSLRQIGRAINTEADKRVEDEDWRLMGEYVQSCRDRLLDIFGVWYKELAGGRTNWNEIGSAIFWNFPELQKPNKGERRATRTSIAKD